MRVIYEPKGKAREYAELAVNLFEGCPHGCVYCFSPAVLRRDRETFHGNTLPRRGILDALERDAAELAKRETVPPVHLCFTCDPYPVGGNSKRSASAITTRQALEILKAHGLNFTVLTKGGLKAKRDFDLYGEGDSFGATLTLANDYDSRRYEPFAATPINRALALKAAHDRGIKTWASLEPVIIPEQTLALIEFTADFVDHFKVGKLNYHPLANAIDWHDFTARAVDLLEGLGKSYYAKESLRAYLPTENRR